MYCFLQTAQIQNLMQLPGKVDIYMMLKVLQG